MRDKPVSRQVVDYILDHPQVQHTAMSLMTDLGFDQDDKKAYDAIRRTLATSWRAGDIKKMARGYYQAPLPTGRGGIKAVTDQEPVLFHGITLIGSTAENSQSGGSPAIVSEGCEEIVRPSEIVSKASHHVSLMGGDPPPPPPGRQINLDWFKEADKDGGTRLTHVWRDREIKVVFRPHLVEIRSQFSDDPLNIPEMDAYISFLEGLFSPYFWAYEWSVRSLGPSTDLGDWYMEGMTSLTLVDFRGIIRRWYNHKGKDGRVLRREIHGSTSIPLREMLAELKEPSPIGQTQVLEALERSERLIKAQSKELRRLTGWVDRLSDKVASMEQDEARAVLFQVVPK